MSRRLTVALVSLLLALAAPPLVRAQGVAIEPSDRVVNFVNVREEPSTGSVIAETASRRAME